VLYLFPKIAERFFKRHDDSILQYIFVLAMVFLGGFLAEVAGPDNALSHFVVPAFSPRMKLGMSFYAAFLIDALESVGGNEVLIHSGDDFMARIEEPGTLVLVSQMGEYKDADFADTLTPEDYGAETLEKARMRKMEPVGVDGPAPKKNDVRKKGKADGFMAALDFIRTADGSDMDGIARAIEARQAELGEAV